MTDNSKEAIRAQENSDPRGIFFEAMKEKMDRRAAEKNRPPDPWNTYTVDFITSRLIEEYNEWRATWRNGHEVKYEDEADELLDIANFAMFRWLQIQRKLRAAEDIFGGSTRD